jgi:predicted RNA-binding protein
MFKIKVGSKVICRLFNTPEKKFYGDSFQGEVVKIRLDDNNQKIFTVNREYGTIDLKRKEIKQVLS